MTGLDPVEFSGSGAAGDGVDPDEVVALGAAVQVGGGSGQRRVVESRLAEHLCRCHDKDLDAIVGTSL